jgi:hypothetical protein
MIVRALFALSLVAVLAPREPDIGFGRPGLLSGLHVETLAPRDLDRFRAMVIDRLQQVKIEFRDNQRGAHGIVVGEERGVAGDISSHPIVSNILAEARLLLAVSSSSNAGKP